MHSQEIGGKVQFAHHRQFFLHELNGPLGWTIRVTVLQPLYSQTLQTRLRGFTVSFLMRVFIGQLAQVKTAPVGDFQGSAQRCRVVAKEARHISP